MRAIPVCAGLVIYFVEAEHLAVGAVPYDVGEACALKPFQLLCNVVVCQFVERPCNGDVRSVVGVALHVEYFIGSNAGFPSGAVMPLLNSATVLLW